MSRIVSRVLKTAPPKNLAARRFVSFNDYQEQDWSVKGPFKALHSMNEVRIPWIIESLGPKGSKNDTDFLRNTKLLDVGCGAGILSIALASIGANVMGIDSSSKVIEIAYNRAKKSVPSLLDKNLRFQVLGADELEFTTDERFDAVIASEVVEHVENVPQFVLNCVNLTKPGGMVYFTTINKTIPSLLFVKLAAEYILRVVPAGIHSWNMFVEPKDLEKYLLSYCVKDIESTGFMYNPLFDQWSKFPILSMNYGIKGRKLNEEPVYSSEYFQDINFKRS
ncbi:Hexaprenyldihydroxybenzoate methyltransferase, mitochondrial [Thelohanellus kitauei]|uniref:Hexaprenyldihydroxybenzoate methyltransferase, mitochondrial n=1 Tax=Thelohanellus kitauei TaxID=669202 RepID=A0A0C2MVR5_THEKT|nr:Hexaprenyldihydroxybenzoate methyltransferase, mitochondrial [Thelohanellus kitauei]